MKRKLIAAGFLLLIGAMIAPAVIATEDEPLTPKALEISNNLNCPVCEGQSVRDSNSQLARDMRRTVQEMLNDGHSEEEVYEYFTDRYGVGILRNPPKSGFFMTLWWAPVIGIAIGALILGTFVTQKRRKGNGDNPSDGQSAVQSEGDGDDDDLAEYEERLLREMEEDSRTDGRR